MLLLLLNTPVKKNVIFIFVFFFIVAFSGCSTKTAPVINDQRMTTQAMRSEDILDKISFPGNRIIKAIANIEVNNVSGRYSTKAALLIRKWPSSLRIEAIPIFGPVNFFLSIHKDVIKTFLPQKGTFYIGKATTENLVKMANFVPEGIGTEDLLSIMLGTYPTLFEKKVSLKASPDGTRYCVDMISNGRKLQSLWIDPSNQHLVEVQVFKMSDKISYTAKFEEFNESAGPPAMPQKITLSSGTDNNLKIIIRYLSIQFDTDSEALTFDLQIPPGLEPIYLDY
jgi:hypothetical protein